MTKRPVRVLHVINSLKRGGAETLLLNYHHAIDRKRVQFDYLLSYANEGDYEPEVRMLGGRIFRVVYKENGTYGKLSYLARLFFFLLTHRYRIIHVHLSPFAAQWPLLFAKVLKFPHRIIHSHNSRVESGKEGKPLTTARQRIKQNATHRFACSHDAGDFLFGKDAVDSGQVSVLINTINAKKYVYNEANRTSTRQQLNINHGVVAIGSVARFEEQKNHTFMLQVMEELQKHGNKWTLILIGEGTLLEQTKAEATLRNVATNVRFMNATGEIPKFLSAFDLLLIPSLHEGIPLAIIEAQAASLPSLASKGRIPEAAACTDIVHFLPLEEGPKAWAAWIAKFTPSERSDGQLPPGNWDAGYDVNSSAPKLTAMYEAMVS